MYWHREFELVFIVRFDSMAVDLGEKWAPQRRCLELDEVTAADRFVFHAHETRSHSAHVGQHIVQFDKQAHIRVASNVLL